MPRHYGEGTGVSKPRSLLNFGAYSPNLLERLSEKGWEQHFNREFGRNKEGEVG